MMYDNYVSFLTVDDLFKLKQVINVPECKNYTELVIKLYNNFDEYISFAGEHIRSQQQNIELFCKLQCDVLNAFNEGKSFFAPTWDSKEGNVVIGLYENNTSYCNGEPLIMRIDHVDDYFRSEVDYSDIHNVFDVVELNHPDSVCHKKNMMIVGVYEEDGVILYKLYGLDGDCFGFQTVEYIKKLKL